MNTNTSNDPKSVRVQLDSEVLRKIRQHARSSMRAEVCGVLIGSVKNGFVVVEACIAGENAAQGGAHVTFTQETWAHIYKEKDREHPDKSIVGWYHSHPGFGVFLSDHDLFIHEHFFSAPHQLAWVFDPHSDEEGCFGWQDGKTRRLSEIGVLTHAKPELEITRQEPPPPSQPVAPRVEPAKRTKPPRLHRRKWRWAVLLCVVAGAAAAFVSLRFGAIMLPSISNWKTPAAIGLFSIVGLAVLCRFVMRLRKGQKRGETKGDSANPSVPRGTSESKGTTASAGKPKT